MGAILSFLGNTIAGVCVIVGNLLYYSLIVVLPTLIRYVGVPLFLFGCLTGLGVSAAVLLGIMAFLFIYYNYLKKIKNIDPYEKVKESIQQK